MPKQVVDGRPELQALARNDQAPRLDVLCLKSLENLLDVRKETENRDALHALAHMGPLVREQSNCLHGIRGVALEAPNQMVGLLPGAGDQDRRAVNALECPSLLALMAVGPVEHPRSDQEKDLY